MHKSSLVFPFKINKLNYNLYIWGRGNSHILPNLCERAKTLFHRCFVCRFTFAVRCQHPPPPPHPTKQKKPVSLPTYMHIGNPLTQRHHLPVCTEQQQPLWILNLNGLIVPPTPICSKAAREPLSSKLWSPCRFFFFPNQSRICLPLKSHCEAAREYKF